MWTKFTTCISEIPNILWSCCRLWPSDTLAGQPFCPIWPIKHWPSSSWGDIWLVGTGASRRRSCPASDAHISGWTTTAPPCRSTMTQIHQKAQERVLLGMTCLPWRPLKLQGTMGRVSLAVTSFLSGTWMHPETEMLDRLWVLKWWNIKYSCLGLAWHVSIFAIIQNCLSGSIYRIYSMWHIFRMKTLNIEPT